MTTSKSQLRPREAALLEKVEGVDQVVCYIPGCDPVGLDEGLRWLRSAERQGLETDFRVVTDETGATVWMKSWELLEIEPDWPEEWPRENET